MAEAGYPAGSNGPQRTGGGAVTKDAETELARQVAAMRVEVRRLESLHRRSLMRHGWLKPIVNDLETNPRTQYKVHLYGAIYWLVNFPLVIALFFGAPALWLKLGIFITLIYSIYANFATDYGAMSAAMAAFEPDHPSPPAIPLEAPPPGG
jgi:hypothetical protein